MNEQPKLIKLHLSDNSNIQLEVSAEHRIHTVSIRYMVYDSQFAGPLPRNKRRRVDNRYKGYRWMRRRPELLHCYSTTRSISN